MNSETIAAPRRAGVDWRRAEFVLTLLVFLGFIALPIHITTIYSGLPAHPLFMHVPVILIPTTIFAAIVFVIKPQWLTRYGIALALVSIVAMSSVFLAMQAGAALRGDDPAGPSRQTHLRTFAGRAHSCDRLRAIYRHADPHLCGAADLRWDANRPRNH